VLVRPVLHMCHEMVVSVLATGWLSVCPGLVVCTVCLCILGTDCLYFKKSQSEVEKIICKLPLITGNINHGRSMLKGREINSTVGGVSKESLP
jgi:hypothetical protein